ncbi:paired amphipathic helix protein Sin3-like protein 2 isoform X1 [Tanacetum coccineum]
MWNDVRLQVDYEVEMAYDLLRLVKRQLREGYCCLADVYAKNHYKSLDHRSFYFKQQDSKTLSMKSLVSKIKEIKESGQKDEDFLHSIASRSRHYIMPNLEFKLNNN